MNIFRRTQKNYKKYIIKDGTQDDRCRRCKQGTENIQHITSGCPTLAPTDYKARHDNVAKILHLELIRKYRFETEMQPYYAYQPPKVLENDLARIYWDRGIITDKSIDHNRPDITVIDKTEKCAYLIDVTIPSTPNLEKAHREKIAKYADLLIEVKKQWRMNTVTVLPVVISATGVIPSTLHETLKKIDVTATSYTQMQKSIILNTCNMVRKFLGDIY